MMSTQTHAHTHPNPGIHTYIHTYERTHTHDQRLSHTVGYSLWLSCVTEGRRKAEQQEQKEEDEVEEEEEVTEEGRAALVVDLDCFLQVGVATSLWSFVEMIQPKPGARVGHVTWERAEVVSNGYRLFPRRRALNISINNKAKYD